MFPPHARGWTQWSRSDRVRLSVSPARAGMDRCTRHAGSASACFPRTRGDGPFLTASDVSDFEFPPHARGWTRLWMWWWATRSVSPARAG